MSALDYSSGATGPTGVTGATGPTGPGSNWTEVVKAADESVASSTTLQNDDELFFTAVSGGQYEVEIILIYGSPAGGGTPDMKVALGEDATNRGGFVGYGINPTDALMATGGRANQTDLWAPGTATTDRPIRIWGSYAGNGGTFRVLWAQNSSGINATIVRAGSVLRYRLIV